MAVERLKAVAKGVVGHLLAVEYMRAPDLMLERGRLRANSSRQSSMVRKNQWGVNVRSLRTVKWVAQKVEMVVVVVSQ
jgi:hypothetical protein